MAKKLPTMKVFKGVTSEQWYWHVQARNGEIVCQSEGYTSKDAARRAALTARRNIRIATLQVVD